ncbi:hypothetical protein RvY_13830 [Ramazzottius varieornatus]|uniref:Uncharacterized protein n=1 Tax=Ramazzottius varieornatus TaxID=947166 RepID=A0A1D1VP84_RAMVA|nr:hypothetical protein RvY_13830 [Ramazzottius varieornatus]
MVYNNLLTHFHKQTIQINKTYPHERKYCREIIGTPKTDRLTAHLKFCKKAPPSVQINPTGMRYGSTNVAVAPQAYTVGEEEDEDESDGDTEDEDDRDPSGPLITTPLCTPAFPDMEFSTDTFHADDGPLAASEHLNHTITMYDMEGGNGITMEDSYGHIYNEYLERQIMTEQEAAEGIVDAVVTDEQQAGRRGKRIEKWNTEKEDAEYETFKQHHQCNKDCSKLTKEQCIHRRHSVFELSRNERFAVLIGFLINAFPRDKTEDDRREAKCQFAYGFDLCRGGFKYVNNIRDSLLNRLRDCVRNGASKELHAKHITSDNQQFPPDVEGTRIITFDFPQSVALPYHTGQAGPSYFKTLLKMALIGLVDETRSKSHFFLMDEGNTKGQNGTGTDGPDSVISMVDYNLSQNHDGEEKLIMYCDNCGTVGQQVKHSMTFVKGEAPFSWTWFNWKAYLEPRYDEVKGIEGSFHFRLFKSGDRGVKLHHCAVEGDAEKKLRVRKDTQAERQKRVDERPTPRELRVAGLDEIRKNQLIVEITQFVSSDMQEEWIAYVKSMSKEPMDEDSEDESNGGIDEE